MYSIVSFKKKKNGIEIFEIFVIVFVWQRLSFSSFLPHNISSTIYLILIFSFPSLIILQIHATLIAWFCIFSYMNIRLVEISNFIIYIF